MNINLWLPKCQASCLLSREPQLLHIYDLDLPEMALASLARAQEMPLKAIAARHLRTPLGCLTKLARDENPAIRCAVASNSRIPHTLILRLASDINASVRRVAVFHPRLTLDDLE